MYEAISLDTLRNICEDWFVMKKQYHIRLLLRSNFLLKTASKKYKQMNESCSHIVSFRKFQKQQKKPLEELIFSSLVHLLSFLEERKGSIFLLGGSTRQCNTVYTNCKHTFPKLSILGRHSAIGSSQQNDDVLKALQKLRPNLLLVGNNMKDGDMWLYLNRENLPPSLCMWLPDCFQRMAQHV